MQILVNLQWASALKLSMKNQVIPGPPAIRRFRRCAMLPEQITLVAIDRSRTSRTCDRLRLILPEGTAIGFRLSHASREGLDPRRIAQ